MKYFFTLFSLLAVLFYGNAAHAQTAVAPAAGDGSADNPFQIATLENLYWLSQESGAWNKHFIQTANINAAATADWDGGDGFSPIGNSSSRFTGSYDGDGYTIDSLTIDRGNSYQGFFGYVYNGTLKNIGLTNVDIECSGYSGALVGDASSSTIDNCYSNGSVVGTQHSLGGLIGYNYSSSVENSYSTGNVTGSNGYSGGLIGYNDNGSVENSYSTGNVTGAGKSGGLIGYNYFSSVENSYSTGNVTGSDANSGGLIGYNYFSSVENSYSTGNVIGTDNVGGFIGCNYKGSAKSSYSTGNVTGSGSHVGGLVGLNENEATVENCYALGSISGDWDVGGIVGYNGNSTVQYSYFAGNISGNYELGNIVGGNYAGTVTASVFNADSSSLKAVGFDDNTGGSITDTIRATTAQMQQQTTYTAIGWDFSETWLIDEGNSFPEFQWSVPQPPSISRISSSNIKTTTATLNGEVNPNGYETTCYFEWGTSSGSYTNSSTSQNVKNDTTIVSTSLTGLSDGTTYYYRLVATNANGTTHSNEKSFTTLTKIADAPTLSSPADGATDVSLSPTLTWSSVTGATSYTVQIARDSTFTQNLQTFTSTQTRTPLRGLSELVTYYWRVRGQNNASSSAYSSAWSFTTMTKSATVTVPDANFRAALVAAGYGITDNGDGTVYVPDIELVTILRVHKKDISDLTGIEAFIELTELSCSENHLTHLDVSANTKLFEFFCYDNQLKQLDVSKNLNLHSVNCAQKDADSDALEVVFIAPSQKNININADFSTEVYMFIEGQDTEVKIQESLLQKALVLSEYGIVRYSDSTLMIPNISDVNELNVSDFGITNLSDLKAFTDLAKLYCYNNNLSILDVSSYARLQYLYCYNNELDSLNLNGADSLKSLYCYNNYLTHLDISHNSQLKALYCYNNDIDSLDISGADSLTYVYCYSNNIKSLDASGAPMLEVLDCRQNPDGNGTDMQTLYVAKGQTIQTLLKDPTTQVREKGVSGLEGVVSEKPLEYALEQNYPNPFNPSTTIAFTMKNAGSATLMVYDVLGRVVFQETMKKTAGSHSVQFNGTNLSSGIYFYRLNAGGEFMATKKMVLLK